MKEICHPRPRGYSGESSNPGRVPADLVQRAIRVLAHFLPLCSIIRTPPHSLSQPPSAFSPLACTLDTSPGPSLRDLCTRRDQTILEAVFTAQMGQ